MTGQLQLRGDGGPIAVCVACGTKAVGPCASCHAPLCGDCCIITDGGAKKWAICPRCAEGGGSSLQRGWSTVIMWVGAPIALLALLIWLLETFAR